MKICGLQVVHVGVNAVRGNWTFLRVCTDAGISGLGEASNVRAPLEVERAARRLQPLLLGMDPFNVESFLGTFGRGAHLNVPSHVTAMSGIETALWDIKGKALGVPVHTLLGGALRDSVRLYANINRAAGLETTADGFAHAMKQAADTGFTAAKFYPFSGLMDGTSVVEGRLRRNVIDMGLERVRVVREAVGPEMDILLQLPPYDMSSDQMIELADELSQFRPFWYQTTFPSNRDSARFAEHTHVPVTGSATGPFRIDRRHWRESLQIGAMDITNPDLMDVGGLWPMKKIAAMAETWGVAFSPHSPYGPVHTAADVHLCATLPNLCLLEYSVGEAPWRAATTIPPEGIIDGHALVSHRPGLGIGLNEETILAHPLGPHPPADGLDPVWGSVVGRSARG